MRTGRVKNVRRGLMPAGEDVPCVTRGELGRGVALPDDGDDADSPN